MMIVRGQTPLFAAFPTQDSGKKIQQTIINNKRSKGICTNKYVDTRLYFCMNVKKVEDTS